MTDLGILELLIVPKLFTAFVISKGHIYACTYFSSQLKHFCNAMYFPSKLNNILLVHM